MNTEVSDILTETLHYLARISTAPVLRHTVKYLDVLLDRWPGAESANVDAETFSGDISSCFGNVAVQRATYGPGSSWRYTSAGATADIHLKSMSGSVNVCNR